MEDPGYGSGRLIFRAGRDHNPEVQGSNPCPATNMKGRNPIGFRPFCFLSNQRAKNYGSHGLINWQGPARITAITDGVER